MIARPVIPLIITTLMAPWFLDVVHHQQKFKNTTPTVTIIAPNNGSFQWNTTVPYQITVVDNEDGNSMYDEIAGAQVFMSIRLLPDSTELRHYLDVESRVSQDVLLMMSASTCFNCHQMKAKLIGPSFASIAQKYVDNEASVTSLTQKVISGTSGSWGDIPMPPHPELEPESVKQIVRWILKNASDPNQNYISGLEGVFKTSQKLGTHSANAIYVLKATYADNGDKLDVGSRKTGQDVVVLKNRP
jgi:cytochrome c551/c552